MTSSSSGLGRGLAAILTGPSHDGPEQPLRVRLVGTALSSLNRAMPLALCGYVHELDGAPEVTLRAPELRKLQPTQAYQLFTAVHDVLGAGDGRHRFDLGAVPALGVLTTSPHRRSLFFFGDEALDDDMVDRLAGFCEVYAPVLHDHDRPPNETERFHLVLDQDGATVHAQVTVDGVIGSGSAARTHHAAAEAAIGARCKDARLVEVGQVRTTAGAASFVVVAGERNRIAMGAAPVLGGPDAAAALAALRAASVLV